MANSQKFVARELEDPIYSIAGHPVIGLAPNWYPWWVCEGPDIILVLFWASDGPFSNSNIFAYDKHGAFMWRIEAVIQDDELFDAYCAIGWDEHSQSVLAKRWGDLQNQPVRIDLATGKVKY